EHSECPRQPPVRANYSPSDTLRQRHASLSPEKVKNAASNKPSHQISNHRRENKQVSAAAWLHRVDTKHQVLTVYCSRCRKRHRVGPNILFRCWLTNRSIRFGPRSGSKPPAR